MLKRLSTGLLFGLLIFTSPYSLFAWPFGSSKNKQKKEKPSTAEIKAGERLSVQSDNPSTALIVRPADERVNQGISRDKTKSKAALSYDSTPVADQKKATSTKKLSMRKKVSMKLEKLYKKLLQLFKRKARKGQSEGVNKSVSREHVHIQKG